MRRKSNYSPYDRTPPGSSPAHVVVRPRRNEHIDRAIKRFLKKVKKKRIIEDYRNKTEFYEKPSAIRRRKKKRKLALLKKLKESSKGA